MSTPVADQILQPALQLLHGSVRPSRCDGEAISDRDFVELGVARVMQGDGSGRAFLQALQDQRDLTVKRSTWYDAFQSEGRLDFIRRLTDKSYAMFARRMLTRDWLSQFPELAGRPVLAVDGHQIEHATHSVRDSKGRLTGVGHLYALCLHSGLMRPCAYYRGDGSHAHEWPVFRQHWKETTKDDPRTGLALMVVDRAFIDVGVWVDQARRKLLGFISREKENMSPVLIQTRCFAAADPINTGVQSDELVAYGASQLRRIWYRDPASGKELVFITTELDLRPGLIALLYQLRWQIEKCFDVFKNKLAVTKAWGTGTISSQLQSHFLVLTHNILVLSHQLLEEIGVEEKKHLTKGHVRRPTTLARSLVVLARPMTCQFIRLVRNLLFRKKPPEDPVAMFRCRMEAYL